MKGVILEKKNEPQMYLNEILGCMDCSQMDYNWLISDYECYPQNPNVQKKLQNNYCFFSGNELTELSQEETFQWIWGVFSAFPQDIKKDEILQYLLPKAREYDEIWKNPLKLQHPLAEIEMIAWDGMVTICLSKNDYIIDLIREKSGIAVDLVSYNQEIPITPET